jgi:hypothetical protein
MRRLPGERCERRHRLLDMRLLDVLIGLLASLQQGVAAKGRDDFQCWPAGGRPPAPSGAFLLPLAVSIRQYDGRSAVTQA